jgi:Fe-S-cluster-containing dehydrogenase component
MNYAFLIDNRKCIGCHGCSTACKSENEVPVGVNRCRKSFRFGSAVPENGPRPALTPANAWADNLPRSL